MLNDFKRPYVVGAVVVYFGYLLKILDLCPVLVPVAEIVDKE